MRSDCVILWKLREVWGFRWNGRRSAAVEQKSPLWKKIIANVMNMKVDVIESEEGPALGGAMLAAVGCGEYEDVETIAKKLVKVIDTVEPEEELVAKYEERYQKFRKIYPTVKELF